MRGGADSDAFRGGHGEVGVRKVGNGDNCEDPLEGWYNPADKGEGEETETVDGRRAIRVRPKTRCEGGTAQARNFHTLTHQHLMPKAKHQ